MHPLNTYPPMVGLSLEQLRAELVERTDRRAALHAELARERDRGTPDRKLRAQMAGLDRRVENLIFEIDQRRRLAGDPEAEPAPAPPPGGRILSRP